LQMPDPLALERAIDVRLALQVPHVGPARQGRKRRVGDLPCRRETGRYDLVVKRRQIFVRVRLALDESVCAGQVALGRLEREARRLGPAGGASRSDTEWADDEAIH